LFFRACNEAKGKGIMKRFFATAAITILTGAAAAGGAFAQTAAPSANPNASTPAVVNHYSNNPGAPAAGANSFTEAQAKSRIEKAGYTNVSSLSKDKDGIWKGKASKGAAPVDVGVDYQGNVVSK
jgi:hypothetical protein